MAGHRLTLDEDNFRAHRERRRAVRTEEPASPPSVRVSWIRPGGRSGEPSAQGYPRTACHEHARDTSTYNCL